MGKWGWMFCKQRAVLPTCNAVIWTKWVNGSTRKHWGIQEVSNIFITNLEWSQDCIWIFFTGRRINSLPVSTSWLDSLALTKQNRFLKNVLYLLICKHLQTQSEVTGDNGNSVYSLSGMLFQFVAHLTKSQHGVDENKMAAMEPTPGHDKWRFPTSEQVFLANYQLRLAKRCTSKHWI